MAGDAQETSCRVLCISPMSNLADKALTLSRVCVWESNWKALLLFPLLYYTRYSTSKKTRHFISISAWPEKPAFSSPLFCCCCCRALSLRLIFEEDAGWNLIISFNGLSSFISAGHLGCARERGAPAVVVISVSPMNCDVVESGERPPLP